VELRSDLERLKKVAQEAYQELRTTLDLLNSQKAGYAYLARELSDLTRKFSESVNMKVLFDCDIELLDKKVSGDVARQVRRLVQEALWNSLQHSMSETAIVNLKESKAGLMVTITDDGCGFDPDSVVTNHYGLRNMRERAEAINGSLFVTSQAGKGTQITLQIPREDIEG
jgi:NarL family two-component system sensor histidine kinase LiaS